MKKRVPTLVLTRVQFYEDCTVGRLSDKDGRLLCMTLEPRWRQPEKKIRRKSCIAAGVYHVAYGYDRELKYQCWLLWGKPLKTKIRLCFLAKGGSVAAHTQGDILLGYLNPDGDEERAFEGQLYRPVEAFERLLAYYASLRANHDDLRMRVEPTTGPVTLLPAVKAPDLPIVMAHVEDYILQTL